MSKVTAGSMLQGLPEAAPRRPENQLVFADVAVTATANDFKGIYRGKQYHEPDFPSVLDRAQAHGVQKVMLTGMSLPDILFNLDIARSRPSQCSITIGVHPYHASEPYANDSDGKDYYTKMADSINEVLGKDQGLLTAYGELGLDYDNLAKANKETQIKCFKDQLDLYCNNSWDLPLFLHCRASFDDFVQVITPYLEKLPKKGLVHSFVGSTSQMQQLVSMGFDISVNGFSFKYRESLDMVAATPLENLQLETDAPWGIIQPSSEVAKRYLGNFETLPQSRKKDKFFMGDMVKERNESCAIGQVAFVVAGLKGIAVEEVTEKAWENSSRMFGWKGE